LKFNVYFYDAFQPSLKGLTKPEQGAVMVSLLELAEDPRSPGLNVHRVGDASTRCWSARVNDDIRLIFFWVDQTIVPAYVAHHDDRDRRGAA
jgi:mRNA-degrading endonuclease RelE of RelBE toxin-antitoxin system